MKRIKQYFRFSVKNASDDVKRDIFFVYRRCNTSFVDRKLEANHYVKEVNFFLFFLLIYMKIKNQDLNTFSKKEIDAFKIIVLVILL